jgi:transaldolase
MSFLSTKRIKLFADCADQTTMLELAKRPEISGFTTNPTLMRKAGVADYRAFGRAVLDQVTDRPISFEVFADDFPTMEKQAHELASWAKNVYVKIPITNTAGESSAPLIKSLSHAGVKVNATGLCTLRQVVVASEALRGGAPSVVSVFAGRIADTGRDPMPIMAAAVCVCAAADPGIELLWASPRELLNLIQAEQVGCAIITATADVLNKIPLIGKDLEQFSRETVQMFYRDAQAAKFSL